MIDPTIAPSYNLINIGLEKDADFLRLAVQLLNQLLMELEVGQKVGAGKYERTPERKNYRNSHRQRAWKTRVREIDLAILYLRKGSDYPYLLEMRRPTEKALLDVIQEIYVNGLSIRKVDPSLKAGGLTGVSKCSVSRI